MSAFKSQGRGHLDGPVVVIGTGLLGASIGLGLRGRGVPDPLAATASNFLRAMPLALLLGAAFVARAHADVTGIMLAIASGALNAGSGWGPGWRRWC